MLFALMLFGNSPINLGLPRIIHPVTYQVVAGLEAELASTAMEKTEMKMEISKRAGELQKCKDDLRDWQKEHYQVSHKIPCNCMHVHVKTCIPIYGDA